MPCGSHKMTFSNIWDLKHANPLIFYWMGTVGIQMVPQIAKTYANYYRCFIGDNLPPEVN